MNHKAHNGHNENFQDNTLLGCEQMRKDSHALNFVVLFVLVVVNRSFRSTK